MLAFGSSAPNAANSASRPLAMPSPRNSPITEATTPMISVSSITERST
jgi:hypothetical protein